MTATFLFLALTITTAPDLQAVLDDQRLAQDVPGISAILIRSHEIVFAGGSGVADLETGQPVTADTVMYMGSLTKILTAVLALQLVESGTLGLEDPVPGIATGLKTDRPEIRVSHLLTHAAGLEREGNFGYWFSADFPDSVALGEYLATADLQFAPGSDRHYSNIGYAALGRVIEGASDQSYADALRDRVLEPLAMASTGVAGSDTIVSTGYTPRGKLIPSAERPFAGVGRRVGARRVRMYHDAQAMSPAFGAYTSARDLGRLALFLLGNGSDSVLSPKMRVRILERQASGWGLGLRIQRKNGRRSARHGGWFAAHRSHFLLDVDAGAGVVVLANSDNADTRRIADALMDALLR